jgi:hypothetical protein
MSVRTRAFRSGLRSGHRCKVDTGADLLDSGTPVARRSAEPRDSTGVRRTAEGLSLPLRRESDRWRPRNVVSAAPHNGRTLMSSPTRLRADSREKEREPASTASRKGQARTGRQPFGPHHARLAPRDFAPRSAVTRSSASFSAPKTMTLPSGRRQAFNADAPWRLFIEEALSLSPYDAGGPLFSRPAPGRMSFRNSREARVRSGSTGRTTSVAHPGRRSPTVLSGFAPRATIWLARRIGAGVPLIIAR